MTFEDLPPNARQLPLTNAALRADLIDLIVSLADRDSGCVAFLLLDDELRCATPVVVASIGEPTPDAVSLVTKAILEETAPPAVVAALGRPGSALVTDSDRTCHQSILNVSQERGVKVVASYVATLSMVRELPQSVDAA